MRLLRKLIDREPEELEYYSWMVLCQALWGKRSGAADYAKQGLKAFAEKHVSVEKLSRPDHLCQYGFFLYFAGSSQQAYEIFGRARRDLQSLLRGILRDRALQSLRPRS